MDFKRLAYFTRIAELGSLSAAAERLHVSQPSLSRQMRLLEEELGLALFARHRRGMRLTREGEELFARIAAPLGEIDAALREMRQRAAPATRPAVLTFGVPPTIAAVLAGPLARRVGQEAPHITLRLVEGFAGHLANAIGRGEIDLVLLYGPSSEWASTEWAPIFEPLDREDLLEEHLELIGPAGSPLDPARPITPAEMARMPLILPARTNQPRAMRDLVDALRRERGGHLPDVVTADSFQLTKDFVEAGLGHAILPPSAIAREVAAGRMRHAPIAFPGMVRRIVLASRPDSPAPQALDTLKTLLRAEVAALVEGGSWAARLL